MDRRKSFIEFNDEDRVVQLNMNFILMEYDQVEIAEAPHQTSKMLDGTLDLIRLLSEPNLDEDAKLSTLPNTLVQVHASDDIDHFESNMQILSVASGEDYIDMSKFGQGQMRRTTKIMKRNFGTQTDEDVPNQWEIFLSLIKHMIQ